MGAHRILLLFRKDLLRRRRQPLGVLALIAFPLIFSGMLAMVFSGDGGFPRARLLLEDRDDALAGSFIRNFLQAEPLKDFLEVEEAGKNGAQRIEDDEASALLVIPEGTTEKLLGGESVTFELLRNPAQGILPEVAEQVTAILADVLTVLARLLEQQVHGLALDGVSSFEDMGDLTDDDFTRLALSMRRAIEEIVPVVTEPPLELELVTLEEDPPADESEEDGNGDPPTLNLFLLILPGISVYALFLIGDQMMRDVLTETRTGTLRRQLSAPITGAQIITAKVLSTSAVAGIVLMILATIAGGMAKSAVDFPAFALLSLALVVSINGFAATIYSIARTEDQGATISALFYLVLGFTGGSFIPLDNLPGALRALAPVNPFYWGTQGFGSLLQGGTFVDVGSSIAVLTGMGLLLLVVGSLFLERKILRGDAR